MVAITDFESRAFAYRWHMGILGMPPQSRLSPDSGEIPTRSDLARPKWVNDSRLLTDAYFLAERAHGSQTRPDGRTFLEHVVEVAGLLHGAGFDSEIVAAGLLHDSVERGTLLEEELRAEMGADIAYLVLTLSEDATIASFESRKAELRRQVEVAGGDAVPVYAADKLSDIRGLRRAIEFYGDALPKRLGTSVATITDHYRESVQMIESVSKRSFFLPALRVELEGLEAAED